MLQWRGQMRQLTRLASFALGIALTLSVAATTAQGAPAVQPARQTGSTATVPFTGTAVTTSTAWDQEVPAKARNDLAKSEQTQTFSVRDATHWRVDLHVTAPVIDSADQTMVADGRRVVVYSTLFNRAFRLPGGVSEGEPLLASLLRTGAPLGTTSAQYISILKRTPRVTVRSLGQGQVAGRQADILRVAPLGWVSTGSCTGPKACAAKEKGFGSATLWLDQQHAIVLRYETHGVSKQAGEPRDYRYLVTSITFGQGPSDADLAYTPPVAVTDLPNTGSQGGGGGAGPGAQFQAPPGLVAVKNPVIQGSTMQLHGSGYGSEWLSGGPSVAEGLFQGNASEGFLYLKERIRALGLPAVLTTGSAQSAGSCQVWTGTFPDGPRWLSLMRGQIAILVVANKLTPADLVHYAATGICAAPIVPPPSTEEVENTALDHLEVEIDITRQILGTVIAAAPNAADKHTLTTFDTRLEAFDRAVFAIRHRSDPQTRYRPPSFPPPQKDSFADAVDALKGEMGAATHMLAEAETAVQSVTDRHTLVTRGKVFVGLIQAVDGMLQS